MSSPRETHISDLLPAYALNSLDTDEAQQVGNHLQTCDRCYREFREYQAVVDRLGLAASVMRPSPTLKGRLLSRIRTVDLSHAEAEPGIPWFKRLFRPPLHTAWLAAGAVIVVLAVLNLWLAQQVSRYANSELAQGQTQTLSEQPLRTIPLKNSLVAPRARGMLIVSGDGTKGMLIVDGLPAITAERVFQAWLAEKDQPSSAGILNVNDTGYGWVEINASTRPLHEYRYFGVTVEPAGGSIFPTGDNVLTVYQ
jgi:anti-sigma-K factor RskA